MKPVIRSGGLAAFVLVLSLAPAPLAAAAARPAPSQPLQLVLPLVIDDAGLAGFARQVSTPGSPLYGRYEPVDLLARRFGASSAVRSRALRFLQRAGARDVAIDATGMFARGTLTVAAAERTFGTRLGTLRSPSGGADFVAPLDGATAAADRIPPGLRGVATGVVGLDTRRVLGSRVLTRPTSSLPRAHAVAGQSPSIAPSSGSPAGCTGAVRTGGFTPTQYLTAYDYAPLRRAGLAGQGERVALVEIDGFKRSDVRAFARCFGLGVPPLRVFGVGTRRALPPGGEATLDLEVLDAAAPRLRGIDVYENPGNAASVIRSLALPLIVPGAKPQVVSASLGICEPDMVRAFGLAGIALVERDVKLAAATGITVTASSGDVGSSGCVGSRRRPIHALAIHYPSSSPWITAVGGTNLVLKPDNTIASQVVWNDAGADLAAGGGGFSEVFRKPAYQAGAVSGNTRAVPDVAMLADLAPGYVVYCTRTACGPRGPWRLVGGTSAATPLLAGGVALVDQDLRRHGRELLGFMNPLLYGIGGSNARTLVFSDVTAIGNDLGPYIPGSRGRALGCCSARPGYDEASGWGSVDLARLDSVAQGALPQAGDVSVTIPGGQLPVRRRSLSARVRCSDSCRVYAFAVVRIGGGGGFIASSATRRHAGPGTEPVAIGFSAGQLRTLRRALALRRTVQAEVFAVELDAHGHTAAVSSGNVTRVRG